MAVDTRTEEITLYESGRIRISMGSEDWGYRLHIGNRQYALTDVVLEEIGAGVPLAAAERELEKRIPTVVSSLNTAGETPERVMIGCARVLLMKLDGNIK